MDSSFGSELAKVMFRGLVFAAIAVFAAGCLIGGLIGWWFF